MSKNLALFASGSGSNVENLFKQYQNTALNIKVVFCNKPNAYVIERCKRLEIPCVVFSREDFKSSDFLQKLEEFQTDFIVLAGFLWKIPDYLIAAYPDKIINIHPALLPKFGGKGMYGAHVHEAVVDNGETESGITIHLVNENYDEGRIIFQAKCEVSPTDDADIVAAKIHQLEYQHFPPVVAQYVREFKD